MFRCFRCADTAQTRRETPKLRCGAEGGGEGVGWKRRGLEPR